MDETYLLALAIAALVAIGAVAAIRSRSRREAHSDATNSRFAVSTEGMKLCPKCGMGNLWTDRTCVSCRATLRG